MVEEERRHLLGRWTQILRGKPHITSDNTGDASADDATPTAADDAAICATDNHSLQDPPDDARHEPREVQEGVEEATAGDVLREALALRDVEARWRFLRNLISAPVRATTHDSFFGLGFKGTAAAISQWFNNAPPSATNIVVVGAGPVGVFLTDALAQRFGLKVRLLLIENRITRPHVKKPYARAWQTSLGKHWFRSIDPRVAKLLRSLSSSGGQKQRYIGAPINMIETLLLLSCKQRTAARVLFDDPSRYAETLKSLPLDLIFDASGNRLRPVARADALTGGEPATWRAAVDALAWVSPSIAGVGLWSWCDGRCLVVVM